MSELFLKIINMSISASWLVLAVLLLRLVLKKAPKWVSVLLWGFVAVRLVCPISIESALSLIPSAEPIPKQVIAELRTDVQNGIPQTDAPIQDQTDIPVNDKTDTPINEGSGGHDVADVTAPEAQGIQTVTVLTALWTAGVAGMLVYTAVSYFLLQRKVATAVRLRNNIYQSEYVDSPFVLGIVRPKIYLPFQMDSENLALVIAHEEAHIRRKDHWWKPFGFVLLAIHWFNPLMWVGYILLCRDIELACDEKVIKEMDNETKADYMQALVSCSVNRRSIAACPLAFGEVGVKERVKTMMNYKKPAFWIVIAAVALCIVVAVCFLTNPKDYGPQVGNPKLLEFPGVKWGATVEEVKQALNITEEQILTDRMREYSEDTVVTNDHWDLVVTDFRIYGEDVTAAHFQFVRHSGYDFGLYKVLAFFDEDTDMVKLEEELTEIYGQGVGDYYQYYNIAGADEKDVTHLEANAELKYWSRRDKNDAYGNALNDPEYMDQLWVATGAELLPNDEVDLLVELRSRNGGTEEATREFIDQMPLVSMSIANKSWDAVYREIYDTENEHTTHNVVEFNANYLVFYSRLSAFATDRETEVADPSLLEYPGIKWGMTPEEVKVALNISQEQIVSEGVVSGTAYFAAKDLTLFGYPLKGAGFYFSQSDDGVCFLNSISAYFPEETDMAQVRDTMIGIYGEGADWSGQNYRITPSGELEAYPDVMKNPNRLQHYWRVSGKVEDVVDDMEAVMDFYANTYPQASRETIEEYLKRVHIAGIGLVDTADPSGALVDSSVATKNVVQFYGTGLVWHMIHFGTDSVDQTMDSTTANDSTEDTMTAGSTMSYDLPWLCYPDISWGMEPYQIKEILGVTEEQILLDEPMADQYILQIKDFTFLGNEVLCGQFNFIVSDSGQYHFTDVSLYYPEETDMTVVKDGLTAFYGAPKNDRGFTRYKVTDIGSVEDYTDYGMNTLFFPGDTPVEGWWESEVTLADSLGKDIQDRLATRAVLLNKGDEAFGEAVREYLEKEPATFICCTNGYDLAGNDYLYYTKNVVILSAVKYVEAMTD